MQIRTEDLAGVSRVTRNPSNVFPFLVAVVFRAYEICASIQTVLHFVLRVDLFQVIKTEI